jgi:hypothetical protein
MLMRAARARSLDSQPRWLVPALRAALNRSARQERVDVLGRSEVARTLWHFTRDTETVIQVLDAGLQRGTSRFRSTHAERAAAYAAADLGPAAAPLVPGLLRVLDEPACAPAAAWALLNADPEAVSVPLAVLADHLVAAAGADGGGFRDEAVDLLREISRRDPSAVSASARARLRNLAERPRRVVCGSYDDMIRDDEALRAGVRDLLRDLGD